MKKFYIFLKRKMMMVAFTILSFAAVAQVTLPYHEPFNYTVGDSLPMHGWTGFNTGDQILVTAGNLNISGLYASSGNKVAFDGLGRDFFRTITDQTSGTTYYSFIMQVTSLGSLDATGGYFTGFASNTTNFGSTVWTKADGANFKIGLNARSTVAYTSWSTNSYSINTPILIVVSYEIVAGSTNDIAKMWINPNASTFGQGTPPTPDITITNGGTDLASLSNIFLRQDSNNETPFIEVDEIRVGNTWASVTPAASASTPTITVNPATLTGFAYNAGAGPSLEQSFTISGTNLTNNIVITAPTNYEISQTTGTGFTNSITLTQTAGTVANTTIYVRMKTGLAVGTYNNELITASSTGATDMTVSCSGEVFQPIINVNPTSLIDFTYVQAAGGPSAVQSFTVSGANLSGNINIALPTNYELSLSNTPFTAASSAIALTPSNGSVANTTVYVRLKAGLTTNTYNEDIVITSNQAVQKTVSCAGSVTATATPVITVSTTSLTGFTYVEGSGPSAEQSFTISGSDLTANLHLNSSSNYEISTTSGTGFSGSITLVPSSGAVNTTTIYVRLKDGLTAGTYNGGTITATSTGATDKVVTCDGNVTAPIILVSSITVTGAGGATTISTYHGTLQLTATVSPANATNNTVTWSVINGSGSATISNSGLLTAVSDGTVTARATANDASGVFGELVVTISNQVYILPDTFYEPFDYPVGTHLGQTTWMEMNTGDQIFVVDGNLSYSGAPASIGNKVSFGGSGMDYRKKTTDNNSGTIYYSFIMQVSSLGSLDATGGYFTGLIDSTSYFASTVWTKANGTGFNLGLNCRSTTNYTTWGTTVFPVNTPMFIVVSYEFVSGTGNDVAKMWINPSSSTFGTSTPPAPDITITNTGGNDMTKIFGVFIRQDSDTETPNIEMDELRFKKSWADATQVVSYVGETAKIFPNITNEKVNIHFGKNVNARVTVLGLNGSVLQTENVKGNIYTLDVQSLKPGMYLLRIDNLETKETNTTRFIKY